MPHWYSSAPSSRPSSPTRNTRVSLPSTTPNSASHAPLPPSRHSTVDSSDRLSDYFGLSGGTSTPNTPAYGPYTSNTDMWSGSSGAHTPGGSFYGAPPVEVILDSDNLVLRGQGGDMAPAYLSGHVDLNLPEACNIKEINMSLMGKAKVQFAEGVGTGSRNHHYTHPVIHHDWSFLAGDKRHTHTLKAGYHSFPFSLMLDGNLPSSVHTYSGDGIVSYKLRVNVIRSGFASNLHAQKDFSLKRTYTPEALEFNQTLEIENTWPGKIMYALTLPFKAYAAGDDIPVAVKFMPLAKGVKVLSVTSVIKEYTLVHTRHSSHPDSRVAACVKHELRNGKAYLVSEEQIRPPAHLADLGYTSNSQSRATSRPPSPVRVPRVPRPEDSYFPAQGDAGSSHAGPSSGEGGVEEEDLEIGDDEVNTSFTIPIPAFTTPSHSVHPVFVTHKLKWSCSISNPDGHISELRCALPIIILDAALYDEARTAGASTRALLFGGSTSEDAQQVDLPSYNNHVYDRVAVADSANMTAFMPRSLHATPLPSPHSATPPHSRPPSRPASPTRGLSRVSTHTEPLDDVPPRRELSQWADSELLLSLGALRTHSNGSSPNGTPPISRGPSRPISRRNSFTRSGRNSNAPSRPSSPERGERERDRGQNDNASQTSSRSTGFLHLPSSLKGMRPLSANKPILRNSSQAALSSLGSGGHHHSHGHGHHGHAHAHDHGHIHDNSGGGLSRNSVSFTNLPDRNQHSGGGHVSFAHGDDTDTSTEDTVDPISRVPSYAIASRGFLGGGVTPLNVGPPTYDDSERQTGQVALVRHRSDTALVQLGSEAAAEAEVRAGEVDT
ncbi:hypothetical protein BCR39DRAFT_557127 [Naematelia encephala]|uniref:Arrestin C-terminal-like domain-containing protein n=1 Tax=Naematelia encephala TaxID=71784 RepID=A0A1Y2BF33_9TREE|nr:hypothetical protein BCR39DRAFT_557127 [Naematelia encephala]